MNMMSALTAVDPLLSRTEVAGLVALAARTVPPLWPLESAIAVNPLAGFEELPFAAAVESAARQFGARRSLPLAQWRQLLAAGRIDERALRDAAIQHLGGVNTAFISAAPGQTRLDQLMHRLLHAPTPASLDAPAPLPPDAALIAKWCAAFLDQGQAACAMPHRELGLYRAVLAALPHDSQFRALAGAKGQALLLAVPRNPLAAIGEALVALNIAPGTEEAHLAGLIARLPGWAGHLRWRSECADPDVAAGVPAGIADLLALWLLLERSGAVTPLPIVDDPEGALGAVFQTAAEWTYANALVPALQQAAAAPPPVTSPVAQLVFCIDVRSEPFRRALEAEGPFETLGYAGFFGLPIALRPAGAGRRRRLLPVLLEPQHELAEAAIPGQEQAAAALAAERDGADRAQAFFAGAKQGAATAFATAEATGLAAGLAMAARTLAPRLLQRLARARRQPRDQVLAPALHHSHAAFTLAEKVGFAQALFRLTGLAPETARLVVLVGHGGSASNNPYAAALDCGACGGHPGGANARVLATMLNDPAVRAGLADHGIALPHSTWFIAAQHDTTTDAVSLLDRAAVPASHSADLATLEAALIRAGMANRTRRAAVLGRSADDLLTGAVHWGEVRPEWGLAGNAAFIVGPRALSQGLDLGGRAFLHGYDWQRDADGTALTTILTAPMVVAQWINCQYLFSTIDNQRYGSGDKTTQNPVGRIGVLQGNGGDLRVGLPRQSLFADDGVPFHVPQRLLTIVHAPFARVEQVVLANPILTRLFGKGWVRLVVIDPASGKARAWCPDAASQTPHDPES